MSIHHTINAVLATSNLQQMDGYCVCASCNRDDLERNQIVPDGHVNAPLLAEYVERFDGAICWDCYDYTDPLPKPYIPAGHVKCSTCADTLSGVSCDDDRGGRFTEWCLECDGHGYVPGVSQ